MPEDTSSQRSKNGSGPLNAETLVDPFEDDRLMTAIPIVGKPEDDDNVTEPLPEPSLAGTSPQTGDGPLTFDTAYRCEVGLVRPRNEDACLVFRSQTGGQTPMLPFALFIVADGMGGHFGGHIASRRAVRLVAAHVMQFILQPLLMERELARQVPVQGILVDAVQAANYEVFSPDPKLEGGTTLTAALVLGRRLYLAHVGDSRAYIWQEGLLEQITTDHSYVQRLQETGQLSAREAASHPQRNVLYRAVGQGHNLQIDTYTRNLRPGNLLLLCSDGLWGLVPRGTIQTVIEDSTMSLAERNDRLVDAALAAGGVDNITSVLVAVSG